MRRRLHGSPPRGKGSMAGSLVDVMWRHLHVPVRPTSCSTSFSSAGIFSLLPAALKAAGDNGGQGERGDGAGIMARSEVVLR